MKNSRFSRSLSLATLTLAAASPAIADDTGWYVGANFGLSRAHIDDPRIEGGLLQHGFTTTAIADDDHSTGYKLFGGYQFTRYIALEGGYFNLGKFGFIADTAPAGTYAGNTRIKGGNLDVVGTLPLAYKFSAFGRVGVNFADVRDSFSATGAVHLVEPDHGKNAANYKFGAGLQYDVTDSVGLRLEAERFRINDAVGNKGDIDLLSIGVVYRFGRHATAAATSAPPPVARAAEPALVVVPVASQTQQYCSILDFEFEINEDDVQLADKEKLAVVGTFLNKYSETTAVIEGHTDNVGSAERNLQLSQRRADNVRTYLLGSFNLAPGRLTAVGYGETRPIADNATEAGKRQNRRIGAVVACATDIAGLTVVPARLTMALSMEFDRNQAEVKPQYREQLRQLAAFLNANPTANATVEGHTANLQATPELALEISTRRAQNVVSYLVDNFGIARSRLAAQGYGQTRRMAYNTTLDGQQENRRVNVVISYPR
jgi:OmpA-OmpF porin, OOP family